MGEKRLQSPFTICPPGTCPNCFGTRLMLIANDIDVSLISENGTIEKTINVKHESKIYCSDCDTEFDYERYGFFVQPVDELQQRLEEAMKAENLHKLKDTNPFSK